LLQELTEFVGITLDCVSINSVDATPVVHPGLKSWQPLMT